MGNKLSIVDPGKSLTTTFTYDADDRLQQVTHPGGAVTAYTYDKVGNRQSLVRPNHITTTYTYDTLNRLTDLKNVNAATSATVSSYHYQLALDGKRLSVTDNTGATTSYGYDADDRLVSETTPTGTTSYVYDSVGNRISKTAGGTTTSFTYDVDDRNTAYTYNLNGDVLNDGTHSYSYDFEDHLTASGTGATPTASYAYDADGTRIQKVDSTGTTNYLVDTNRTYAEVLEERDGSGNVLARYDYGDDLIRMDRGTSTRYYLFDGLGSTRQLTDGTGAITDTYAYDAFGNMISQTGSTVNPYLFNGQEQDAGTGLYYLRARYMNPQDGRFISQDPFGGDDEDPISLHRYLYASDDPVNRVDPGGQDSLGDTLAAIGISGVLSGIVTNALGGTPAQSIRGAVAGATAAFALVYGDDEGRGIETLTSGFIGGLTALGVKTVLDYVDKQTTSPLTLYLTFLQSFASSALGTALSGNSILQKAARSFAITFGSDLLTFVTEDYNAGNTGKAGSQLLYSLFDAGLSAIFSLIKNGAISEFPERYKFIMATKDLTVFQMKKIALDSLTKILQGPAKYDLKTFFGDTVKPTISIGS